MKIKQLIKQLSKYDENYEVILASDAEGNSYSPAKSVYYNEEIRFYKEDNEFYSIEDEDRPSDIEKKGLKAITIFPSY